MPLELGLFLGAKRYGDDSQRQKRALILDTEPYRYQRFVSDLAGQDIHAHSADPAKAIMHVANWLREHSGTSTVPGGRRIAAEFARFEATLPGTLNTRHLHADDVTFRDFVTLALAYIDQVA